MNRSTSPTPARPSGPTVRPTARTPHPSALTPRPPQAPVTYVVQSAKSPGLAAFLSLLWLGAGHLYADRIGMGILLAVTDLGLCLISLTGIGLFLAIPVWLVLTPLAMALSAAAVRRGNRQVAIPRR